MTASQAPLSAIEREIIEAELDRGARENSEYLQRARRPDDRSRPALVAQESNAHPPVTRLALVAASEVMMENPKFVWEGRVPLGKLTCIEGRMGVGKTTILAAIIAATTNNGRLPGQIHVPQGGAILISLEDGHHDTLVPRLRASGADLTRCHLFDGYEFDGVRTSGIFDLSKDGPRLRDAIEKTGATIVAIDPFTATLGATVNSYKDQDVRRVLAPLAQIAEDTKAAIIFSRHFRKGAGLAEDAGSGSVGIGAACRSVLRVDRDPDNVERFLLSSVKSSLSRTPQTIGYRIESVSMTGGPLITTSMIAWDGESAWTARALASQSLSTDKRARTEEAKEFLLEALRDTERPAKELFRAADAEGISRRTLQRASDELHVAKKRRGFAEGSVWALPASFAAETPSFAPPINMARMGVPDIDMIAIDGAE